MSTRAKASSFSTRRISGFPLTAALTGLTVLCGCATASAETVTLWPTIVGYIYDGDGNPVVGATVSIDNSEFSASTDAGGAYVLRVPGGWSGVLRPALQGYRFAPEAWSFSKLTDDLRNIDFQAFDTRSVDAEQVPAARARVVEEQEQEDVAATTKVEAPDDESSAPEAAAVVFDGPTISGSIRHAHTVGARRQIGPIELVFTGSGEWNGVDLKTVTDARGDYSVVVPEGWTGTLGAADPRDVCLTPPWRDYSETLIGSETHQDFNAWRAPIGIPAPAFGISETHHDYANATYDFGDGPEPYRDAGNGPYTHYVDNRHPAATDTDNPYGTAERPRVTIPYNPPLRPGSVVEVHGGPYAYHISTDNFNFGGARLPIVGNGTAEKPIFVRGAGPGARPVFRDSTKPIRPEGSYIILEHLDIQRRIDIRPKGDLGGKTDHIAVRHCQLHSFEATAVHMGWPHGESSHPEWRDPTLLTDVVIYDNEIYDLGDWEQTGASEDYAGVFPHINLLNAWIIDNMICHVDGDGIQINTWGIYEDPDVHQPARFVYIGGNRVFECQENCLDFKVGHDVVVSQNRIHGIHDHSATSDGTAVVVHEDGGTDVFPYPERLWFLHNHVSDSDVGMRIQLSDDVFVIGNLVCDIVSSYTLLDSGYSSGGAIQCWDNNTIRVVNNVIHGCDLGVLSANPCGAVHLVNNLVANLTDNFSKEFGEPAYSIRITNSTVADVSEMHHNLLYQDNGSIRIRWNGIYTTVAGFQAGTGKGEGCLEEEPLFVDAAEGDFHVQQYSPAIDAGTTDPAYETFFDLYGINIACDYDRKWRPAAPTNIYDIGLYERARRRVSAIESPKVRGG